MTTPGPAPRPLLSFAIPTYQHGHTLPTALDSILTSPRAAEVEIVISNNASTDDTAEVVARYAARYPNVRVRHQDTTVTFDENLARAMEGCTGRFIWTMSSDDALLPDALGTVLDTLAGLEQDSMLVGNWCIADGDLAPVRLRRAPHRDRLLTTPREAVPVVGLWTLFMSCLIVPAAAALPELHRYRTGDGLTHWKIATRLAATGTATIEAGAPYVTQRTPEIVDPPYYDIPTAITQNIHHHIGSLQREVGLTRSTARATQSRIVRVVLRAYAGTALQRWPALARRWFRPLLADYGSLPSFWLWVAPLYALPRPVLGTLWRSYRYLRRVLSGASDRRRPTRSTEGADG